MAPDLPDDLRALLDLARDYLRTREDLRRGVATIGRALVALAEWSVPATEPAAASEPPTPPEAPTTPAEPLRASEPAPETPPVPVASLLPLTFAPPPVSPGPYLHLSGQGDVTPPPLPVIAARCRLKAEACRFVARRIGGANESDAPGELVNRARAFPDCYLWMLDERGSREPAPVWNNLAVAFDAAAEAVDMLGVWWGLPDAIREREADGVLHLAAEAQAVLFAAVAATAREKPDRDQIHLFVTLREEAARLRVFITRYLKREDRADPATGADVARRVGERVVALQQFASMRKNRHKVLANLRYKTGLLRDDPAGNADEWSRVGELLDELVTGGLPPSNAEVRDLILPIFHLVPDELAVSRGAERVFREVDRYLASRPAADEPPGEVSLSSEVAEVRRLLAGREVVLIGGLIRPARRDALIEAFGLADLTWVTAVDHEPLHIFEAPIARPEVRVVLLAIRWSSHSHGDVQDYCDRYGKLLVRLPGGYHPNQVAHQILSQVGQRLRAAG